MFCTAVIDGTVKGRGRKWLIFLDLALFLSVLFLLVRDDYIEAHTLSFGTYACCYGGLRFFILKFEIRRSEYRDRCVLS